MLSFPLNSCVLILSDQQIKARVEMLFSLNSCLPAFVVLTFDPLRSSSVFPNKFGLECELQKP